MTQEEWQNSDDAHAMLGALYDEQPEFFISQIEQLHRFLIACCWKKEHLMPQDDLRNGLKGAEKWIAGEIDQEELNRLNWDAESAAFMLDYCKTPEDIEQIKAMIAGIKELNGMSFDEARNLLMKVAYFAEGTMIFQDLQPKPRAWLGFLARSQFLCADLLREHIRPHFSN